MSKFAANQEPQTHLILSPGEPAGIGPDLYLGLNPAAYSSVLTAVADPSMLEARARQLGLDVQLNIVSELEDAIHGALNVYPVHCGAEVIAGTLNPRNGAYVLDCLEACVSLCAEPSSALVTGPINKAVINEAGIAFSGHTEWLARRTNTQRVVMMLASKDLRVALATTHLPLKDVAAAINEQDLLTTIQILNDDLIQKFNIEQPTILVCGLNPHAGESGHLGTEEIEIIEPTLTKARKLGINVVGPIPADTAFTPNCLKEADAVLAMYHDQGLPVLKHQGFGEAVNITLGLPIIRTSVDHGTALDLAGKGTADPGSLITALKLAEQLMSEHNGSRT